MASSYIYKWSNYRKKPISKWSEYRCKPISKWSDYRNKPISKLTDYRSISYLDKAELYNHRLARWLQHTSYRHCLVWVCHILSYGLADQDHMQLNTCSSPTIHSSYHQLKVKRKERDDHDDDYNNDVVGIFLK